MKKTKKLMTLLAMIILAFGMVNVRTLKTQAASPSVSKKETYCYYKNMSIPYEIEISGFVSGTKATNLKNSNPDVVKAYIDKNIGNVWFTIRKPGTAKISFRYKGKKFTQTVSVVKYENPCEWFKIGNKDYNKCFKKTRYYSLNGKKDLTGTINIKAKKGWKLKKIKTLNMYDGEKKVKNRSKIVVSTKGTGTAVYAYFKNVKTGVEQWVCLGYGYDWGYPGNISENRYY